MNWPLVKLGDVIQRCEETVTIDPELSYREITVKLWGKGVVLRGVVTGAEIAASRRFVARSGQLILSRIDARNGAIGIVPPDLDGAVVTNDFPLFVANTARLNLAFLGWLSRTKAFVDLCLRASEGTTNRVRLQEKRFLELKIRLPPIEDQERIVRSIDHLAAQVDEARTLRQQSLDEADGLLVAMAHRSDLDLPEKVRTGWKFTALKDVIKEIDDSHVVKSDGSYPNVGMYSFGRGLFRKPPIDGFATSAKSLRRIKQGQFIYSRLFAFEGAYGMVTREFDGSFVSQEYPTFECDPRRVRAEFLAAYFKPTRVWRDIAAGSKGLGDRRQRVQPPQILNHELWLPPLEWQNRLAEVQAELDVMKGLQVQTAAELDALLPAILDRAFKGEL